MLTNKTTCYFNIISGSFSKFLMGVVLSFIIGPSLSQAAVKITYLNLYVGLYHDESIPNAPISISTAGTYKNYLKLTHDTKKKSLRFYPQKEGVATLIVKDPATQAIYYEYRIEIRKTNLYKVAREIRNLLKDIEGISIKILNNKVIVDGQILLPRDMGRIHSVVKQYGDQAYSLVTLSPLAQRKIAQLIERDINNPEVHVRAVNGKFILEGMVGTKEERDQAEIIAKAYVPDLVIDEAVADKKVLERKSDVVINLINLKPPSDPAPKKMIQLVVHYVELKKDYTKGFRFQWTPDIGDGSEIQFNSGGRNPGGVVATITGTISNLLPKLNWAKDHGHARILQSSSLIVEDGQKGVIKAMTSVPYQTLTKEGLPSTSFKDTGINSAITPQIIGARSDSINLNLSFEVSALVGITPAGPLVSSRQIQSIIVVRSGQSAAVGGLISNERNTGYNKLPSNASSNPLLSLYASKSFNKNQSQFVVFVTPIIKSSASAGANQIKRKFRIRD